MSTTEIIAMALIKYGPELAKALLGLFQQATPPTAAQWETVFALVKTKSYEDYVKPA